MRVMLAPLGLFDQEEDFFRAFAGSFLPEGERMSSISSKVRQIVFSLLDQRNSAIGV